MRISDDQARMLAHRKDALAALAVELATRVREEHLSLDDVFAALPPVDELARNTLADRLYAERYPLVHQEPPR